MSEEPRKVEVTELLRTLLDAVQNVQARVARLEERGAAVDREIATLVEITGKAHAAVAGHQRMIEALAGNVEAPPSWTEQN